MNSPPAADVAALLGDWAGRGRGSLGARLAFALRARILADLLPGGTVLPPLRAALAERHTTLGLPTTPEQIHVTHGAQHAIDLALATLCETGDAVAVEDPTYPGVLDVLAARRLRPVPPAGDVRGPTPA